MVGFLCLAVFCWGQSFVSVYRGRLVSFCLIGGLKEDAQQCYVLRTDCRTSKWNGQSLQQIDRSQQAAVSLAMHSYVTILPLLLPVCANAWQFRSCLPMWPSSRLC